jgi:hypothetical protein
MKIIPAGHRPAMSFASGMAPETMFTRGKPAERRSHDRRDNRGTERRRLRAHAFLDSDPAQPSRRWGSPASRRAKPKLCKGIDERVNAFLDGPIERE